MVLGRFFKRGKQGAASFEASAVADFPSVGGASGFIPSAITGTHRAYHHADGRVIVRDVELFSEVPDGPLGRVDRATLDKIVAFTNDQRRQGKHTKVIATHSDDAPVIGHVASDMRVVQSDKTGALTIFGDLSFSAADFAQYVASNRFPNRSAEIVKDTLWMSSVALLGRDRPGANIPDVMFSDGGKAARFTAPAGLVMQFSTQEVRKVEKLNELMAAMSACLDAMPEADRKTAAYSARKALAKYGDDKDDDDTDVAKNAATAQIATFQAQIASLTASNDALKAGNDRLHEAVKALQSQTVTAKYAARLSHFKNVRGFTTIDEGAELSRLLAMKDDAERDAHFSFIEKNYRQSATGAALVAAGLPFDAIEQRDGAKPNAMTEDQTEKVVAYATAKGCTFAEAKAAVLAGKSA